MKGKILSLVLVFVLIMALVAGCGNKGGASTDTPDTTPPSDSPEKTNAPVVDDSDPSESFNFIVSLTKGQVNTPALQQYLSDVESASGGRITFEIYYSGSLLAVPEIPQGLSSGVADITEFIISEFPTMFPLSSTIPGLPFLGMTNDTVDLFGRLYDEFPEMQEEFSRAGMHLISYVSTQPYNFHLTTKDEVRRPEDLAGLKIITTRSDVTGFLQNYGASAVASAPPDYYSNLENGVVNGTLLHYPMMFHNGLIPTCKQHVIIEEGGGMYMDTSVYVFAADKWNSLPDDIKAYFTDEATLKSFFDYNQEVMAGDGDKGIEECYNLENQVHFLSKDELAAWKDAFAPVNESTLKALDDQSLPATSMYERALEIIADLKG